MKRKMLMGFTALTLMGAMVLPVSAQENQDTTIKATVQSTYTLSIPAETQIKFEDTSTDLDGTLKVTGNVLPSQEVEVSAQTKAFHNNAQNTDLPYTLVNKADGNAFTGDTWDEDTLRNELIGQGKEIQLAVNIKAEDWKNAEAGEYEGTITFTANLQDK